MSVGSRPVEFHYEEKQAKPEGATSLNPGAHENLFSVSSFQSRPNPNHTGNAERSFASVPRTSTGALAEIQKTGSFLSILSLDSIRLRCVRTTQVREFGKLAPYLR